LPRRRKQSTGLFSSASLPPCSNPSVLLSEPKKYGTLGAVFFLARPEGFLSRRSRAYRLASLVAPSAKTLPRSVFFRFAPSLFESLCITIRAKKSRHTRCRNFLCLQLKIATIDILEVIILICCFPNRLQIYTPKFFSIFHPNFHYPNN